MRRSLSYKKVILRELQRSPSIRTPFINIMTHMKKCVPNSYYIHNTDFVGVRTWNVVYNAVVGPILSKLYEKF